MRVRESVVVALGIAAFDGDQELVAGLGRSLGVLEDGERKDAFGFEADVEEDGVDGDGDYGGFDLLAGLGLAVSLLELLQEVGEGFGGVRGVGFVSGASGIGMTGMKASLIRNLFRITPGIGLIPGYVQKELLRVDDSKRACATKDTKGH